MTELPPVDCSDWPILLDRAEVGRIVSLLAQEITRDHSQGIVLVGVTPGCYPLISDLADQIAVPVRCEAVEVSDYEPGRMGADYRHAEITKTLTSRLDGREVVLVENIIDTGLRAAFVTGYLRSQGASSIDVCALWDRPFRRVVPLDVRYRGSQAPGGWLVGYGLALDGNGRDLGSVHLAPSGPLDRLDSL